MATSTTYQASSGGVPLTPPTSINRYSVSGRRGLRSVGWVSLLCGDEVFAGKRWVYRLSKMLTEGSQVVVNHAEFLPVWVPKLKIYFFFFWPDWILVFKGHFDWFYQIPILFRTKIINYTTRWREIQLSVVYKELWSVQKNTPKFHLSRNAPLKTQWGISVLNSLASESRWFSARIQCTETLSTLKPHWWPVRAVCFVSCTTRYHF